ncbi:MAG: phospholipid carrier-dependent glycosyltransferase, partial [Firmicutes bacterium]|nr:phospholipid carrier-dependent glycosyltransferase [Bacillota bacterium]
DARFVQAVPVEPETLYHLSGWIKAEGAAYGGASLSLLTSYVSFGGLYDTAGEWVYVEGYFRADEGQSEVTVGARLGDYSADTAGKAFFDDLSLTRVDAAPEGFTVQQLRDYSNAAYYYDPGPEPQTADRPAGAVSPLLWTMLFLALLPVLLNLRGRKASHSWLMIGGVMALAALVRLWLMVTQPGYETDMNCFYAWALRMANVGPNAFYSPDIFCDYPPGYMYPLWLTGALLKLFGAAEMGRMARVMVKLMPVAADLAAVCVIFAAGRKRLGDTKAALLAALYAVSPAILVNGAVWGQVDAVMALGLLVTVLLVSEKKWLWALPVYTLTVLMKPQALMAGPVGLAALAAHLYDSEDRKKLALDALKGFGCAVLAAAATLLPFLWGKEAPLQWIFALYTQTLSAYAYATVNAGNLYYLLGANWRSLNDTVLGIPYGQLGAVLMALVVAGVMALCWRKRKEDKLPFFGALIFMGLYLFGVRMHERYLFPALLLLLYAYIRRPDWRCLALFAGFSVTLYVNCAAVLRDVHLMAGYGGIVSFLSAVNLLLFALAVWTALDAKRRPLPEGPAIKREGIDRLPAPEGKTPPAFAMRPRDWRLMLGLTAVYAVIAYVGLGAATAPQTTWVSTGAAEEVVFDLGGETAFTVLYYGNITSRDFTVECSVDGETWTEPVRAEMNVGECFRWKYLTPEVYDAEGNRASKSPQPCEGRYVRLISNGPSLQLMEVGFRGLDGNLLPVASVTSAGGREENTYDPMLLIDEQDVVPAQPSYLNSTYFDEIYHARTGYEHLHRLPTYETTHPPLGKVFIMWGIRLFGMTAFGWRFMGTLMGVLMVPAMYLMAKLLFKKTRYAFLGAFVMAFDLMHLTQTRIATIDSYAVLFIILMYLCMFRYMQMSFLRDGWRTLIPLGLSGLFMGLACASKWIGFYASVGLAALLFWSLFQRLTDYRRAMEAGGEAARRVKGFGRYVIGTLASCVVFFVVIPAAIYYFSYIPYFAYEGGLTWQRFWNAQIGMYSYHATPGLGADHPFQSPWYEWPLILKPIYYYNGSPYVAPGMISTIMSLGNPAVWWAGLAAILYVIWTWAGPRLRGEAVRDHRPAMLVIAFAAQFLPWVLVPRSMYIYHYFGSLPFVMMAIVFAFEKLYKAKPDLARAAQIAYMAVIAVLFAGFYPVATGVQVPRAWADAVNWFGGLYLPGWRFRGWLYY